MLGGATTYGDLLLRVEAFEHTQAIELRQTLFAATLVYRVGPERFQSGDCGRQRSPPS